MTKNILYLFFTCFSMNVLICQTELHYGHNGKIYNCYTSLSAADAVNPDSVYAIALSGKSSGVPKQILKYKNLQYLYLGSTFYTNNQDKKLSKKKSRKKIVPIYGSCDRPLDMPRKAKKYYTINDIPEWISQLKQLEEINFLDAKIKNVEKYKKIFQYLPKAYIRPDTFDLKYFYNKGLY